MEPSVPDPRRRWTEDEYLQFEDASEVKHEFRDGQVVAMAGGTHEHGIIALNLGGELRTRLRDTPCVTAGRDVRVRASADGSYSYPDLTAAFRSLDVGVPMAEVYAKVRFPTPGDESEPE